MASKAVDRIPGIEMPEDAVELREIDVGHPRVAPDQQHVFVIADERAGGVRRKPAASTAPMQSRPHHSIPSKAL